MGRLIDATTFADLEARRFTLRVSATRRDTKASRKDTKMQQSSELPGLGQGASSVKSERESLDGHARIRAEVDVKQRTLNGIHFVTAKQLVFHGAYYINFTLRRLTQQRTMLHFRAVSRDFRVSPRCRAPKGETLRLRSAKVGTSMSRPTKANLKANCAGLQAEPQAQRFSREMRPRRRRRVARGEAEPRSGRKRPRDSATHCRRQPKTSLRPPCALSVANQLCLATKGAQRGTKVFRVGAPPQTPDHDAGKRGAK